MCAARNSNTTDSTYWNESLETSKQLQDNKFCVVYLTYRVDVSDFNKQQKMF